MFSADNHFIGKVPRIGEELGLVASLHTRSGKEEIHSRKYALHCGFSHSGRLDCDILIGKFKTGLHFSLGPGENIKLRSGFAIHLFRSLDSRSPQRNVTEGLSYEEVIIGSEETGFIIIFPVLVELGLHNSLHK